MSPKIDLFIVGAQKCGTTSLKNYLGEHPEIKAQFQTEMTYFVNEDEFRSGYSQAYKKYFADNKKSCRVHVGKYVSLPQSELGLHRLKEHNPDAKVIYMVRNPVQRAYSSYLMEQSVGDEKRGFDHAIKDALANTDSWQYRAYIGYGFYIQEMHKIQSYFPTQNIKVIVLEEFKSASQQVLSEIFDWLDVDSGFVPNIEKVHNEGGCQRFRFYNRILRTFLHERNLLKRSLKLLLPSKLTSAIGFELRQFNKEKNRKADISDEIKHLLTEIYSSANLELAAFMGRSQPIWK